MNIDIVAMTYNPIDVISRAAGTSYGKNDTSEKRVKNCFNRNHMSVFEHACFTVRISGISRACSHQLVRHRLASFVQESQRYTEIDVKNDDWYVMPPSMREQDERLHWHMDFLEAAWHYEEALDNGIKPEDARYLLPEATKTTVTMTMNVREFFTFLDLRTDQAAQWEIRNLANELMIRLWGEGGQWSKLIDLWRSKNGEAK